jgi:hypothetical protein
MMENLWQEIVTSALLGTARKPFQAQDLPEELEKLLRSLDQTSGVGTAGERQFLQTAAAASVYWRAGCLPAVGAPAYLPACPEETLPRCGKRAGNYLVYLLETNNTQLLPEWIELAAAHQVRVREEHLPALLGQQKTLQEMRKLALPVLGERGRWLAGLNPEWSIFAHPVGAKTWQEGQRKERQAFLMDLRASDPDQARDLLAAGWQQEAPEERAAWIRVLADGLSMADEEFLEMALSDRRKEVRQAAAALLAQLSASRLVQRVTARAQQMLTCKSGLLRSSLAVTIPEICDDAMQRDGIETTPPAGSKISEKAWWLEQILAVVSLCTWTAGWNKKAQAIIDLARGHQWEEALISGWTQAAVRAEDPDWIEALLDYELKRADPKRMYLLVARLPEIYKTRLLISLMNKRASLSHDASGSSWLLTCRFRWGQALTQAVTANICYTLERNSLQPWSWEILLREIGPLFHPESLQESCERIDAALSKHYGSDPCASGLLATLRLRLNMRQAFAHQQ